MEIAGFIVIVMLVIGLISHNNPLLKKFAGPSTVLSSQTSTTPSVAPAYTSTPTQKPPTLTPARVPTPIPTTPTSSSAGQGQTINDFRYSNSTVISSNATSLTLTSTDPPESITDWYKQKIQTMHLNAKSFVTTKSNDTVLNKLVGANSTTEVSVTITRENASSSVTINVNLKSSS